MHATKPGRWAVALSTCLSWAGYAAGPHPAATLEHGYACDTTPCLSITHASHDFGAALAEIRPNRLVVGAPFEDFAVSNRAHAVATGAVFIYDEHGNVLTSIVGPSPESGDEFGAAVAAVSNLTHFVVGAPGKKKSPVEDVGAAYIYDDAWAPVTTLSAPQSHPNARFGSTVARLGLDAVLVAAEEPSGGAVWSYSMAGALLNAFTNPVASAGDQFGAALVELNASQVIIGAPGEDLARPNMGMFHAYLPSGIYQGSVGCPVETTDAAFGSALAALHPNLLAVGAPGIDTVFLYDAASSLVDTIPNPFPGEVSAFGRSLVALSPDRLLIGAAQPDGGAAPTGRVFLYDSAGHRLLDLDISETVGGDRPEFGWALAPLGSDGFVVGDPGDDTLEPDAGAAYTYRDLTIVTQSQFRADSEVVIRSHTLCGGSFGCIEPELAVVETFGSVTFTNQSSFTHRLVSGTPSGGPDGCFDTGVLSPGDAYTQIVDDRIIGDLDYYCSVHTTETARLRIDDNEVPSAARVLADGVDEPFRMDDAMDMEWMEFFAVPSLDYTVTVRQDGGQVDAVLELFYQLPNGTLSPVSGPVNLFSTGIGVQETVRLTTPTQGVYVVNLSYIDLGVYGENTEVTLTATAQSSSGFNVATVVALDRTSGDNPPAGGRAYVLDLGWNVAFTPGIPNVDFPNIPAGNHTFQVTANAHILPLDSNPRNANVAGGAWIWFQFARTFTVTGRLRDQWTGEDIAGAGISFVALDGYAPGTPYTSWPPGGPAWSSQPNGQLPVMTVPVATMLVQISRYGYQSFLTTIPAPATGTFINADPLYMTPVDNNLNGMADFWESAVAPGIALTANGDPDGDHSTNREEYLAGTDPLDPNSVFAIQPTLTAGGLVFTWPLAAGRNYAVQSADLPTDKSWAQETTTLPFNFFLLGWADLAPLDDDDKVYRIQLSVP